MEDSLRHLRAPHELLTEIIDEWVAKEQAERRKIGIPCSKTSLKAELGRSLGLGNGADPDSAGRAIYRLCSGEQPLSLDRALDISHRTRDYRLVQWFGYQAGVLMTPRAAIGSADSLEDEDLVNQLARCLQENSSFVGLLSNAYTSKPSRQLVCAVEEAYCRLCLELEKTRLLGITLLENALSGKAGEGRSHE